jgi:hypothetical protein
MSCPLAEETGTNQVARPNWEYIRVDVLLPEHPKVEGLSDKAFRALITLWCYCGRQRTDGAVTRKQWEAWPPKVRAELITAGLVRPVDLSSGAAMHDFLEHQRSREEIDELSARRSEAGKKAAEARWGGRDTKSHGLPHTKTHPRRMRNAHAIPMPRQRQRQIQPRTYGTTGASTCS